MTDFNSESDRSKTGWINWGPGMVVTSSATAGFKLPEYQSRLLIHQEFQISFHKPMPHWWFRFWYWVLLGWRWEKV